MAPAVAVVAAAVAAPVTPPEELSRQTWTSGRALVVAVAAAAAGTGRISTAPRALRIATLRVREAGLVSGVRSGLGEVWVLVADGSFSTARCRTREIRKTTKNTTEFLIRS